jgi:AcrR family transcriptional regulator
MHVGVEGWDEDSCLDWLWRERFSGDGAQATCESCGRERRFHRIRSRRAFGCDSCGHQIYPTAGTVFQRSRAPLSSWFYAVQELLGPNPPTAKELSESLEVGVSAARRMRERLLSEVSGSDEESQLILRLQSALAAGRPPAGPTSGEIQPSRSREDAVDVIRAAACRAFAENGVEGTRIIDIAEEAGVSASIIHYYFQRKDEVLLAALQWANSQIERTLAELSPAEADSVGAIASMLELSVPYEGLLRDEMLLWLEVWVRARQHPMLVSESYAISETWHRQMSDVIKRGAKQEVFDPVATPDEIAHRLIAAANGLGFKAAVGHGGLRQPEVRRLLLRLAAEQLRVPFRDLQKAGSRARKGGRGPIVEAHSGR